jgi:hypothetical protein
MFKITEKMNVIEGEILKRKNKLYETIFESNIKQLIAYSKVPEKCASMWIVQTRQVHLTPVVSFKGIEILKIFKKFSINFCVSRIGPDFGAADIDVRRKFHWRSSLENPNFKHQ